MRPRAYLRLCDGVPSTRPEAALCKTCKRAMPAGDPDQQDFLPDAPVRIVVTRLGNRFVCAYHVEKD